MPSPHISLSGGLLTHQFIEAVQQPSFNHPAAAPETFVVPGRKSPGAAELERAIGAAWELLVERWDSIENEIPGMDISALRERWIRPLFTLLDFGLEYQRADLVLEDDLRFPISHLGLPVGAEQFRVPVHSVLPEDLAGGLDARREGGVGLKRLAPHDLVQRYLNLCREALWGFVTDGLRLRLLRDYHHTYTRGYVEFDLAAIFAGRDFAAFRALYRLCHSSRFVPRPPAAAPSAAAKAGKGRARPAGEEDEEGEGEPEDEAAPAAITPLEKFYQDALSTGVKVGEDLRNSVRDAIESLANGFLQATPGLGERIIDRESRAVNRESEDPNHHSPFTIHSLYEEILHTIYRMLFLLFAEQRGMFPGRGSLYMEEYSLTAFRVLAEQPRGEDPHLDLWEKLKTTFAMVEHGAPGLGVFGYDGALFASSKTPILTPSFPHSSPLAPAASAGVSNQQSIISSPSLRNDSLLRAIRALTAVERDKVTQRISYADLSVEEIGSVYESLLDYTPRIASTDETVEGREIKTGTFFLDPRGKERKTTGSYYTHPSLVNELIKSALAPVLEERLQAAAPGCDPDHPEKLSPAEKLAAEEALLGLKVIDPAAGSGAFLIAADNTLGLRLAQIRTGDLYPPEREIRHARRDTLAHCLFAVDLNPLAVELCKLSLWINAVVEDQKLNFLDHHIRCGNSLVGARRDLVAKGIPSEAYGGAAGDDKDLTRAVKKQNDAELGGQLRVLRVIEMDNQDDFRLWLELERLAQDDPAEAERRYLELQAKSEESAERLAYDLWTAAFFWPLPAEERRLDARMGIQARRGERQTPLPPTTRDVFQALATPRLVNEARKAMARELRDEARYLHWELDFPEVYGESGSGGFDVVLGNPPWERIKLQEKEFFAVYAPEIAAAPNAAARKRRIEELPRANPPVWALYVQALRGSECTSKFLRSSGRFPLGSGGDINTYSVFAEHDRDLVSPTGRAGIIVPSGIATDFTNKEFFADLVDRGRLVSLYDFENRRKLFEDVDSRMKFSLLTLRGAESGAGEPAEFAFFLLSSDDLADPERRFTLTAEDFALLNPNTRTCPIFRTKTDAELTRKLYRAAPVLVNEVTGENPWGVSFLRMFDMTNDNHLFRTNHQLRKEGFHLMGSRFIQDSNYWLPLYEGRLGHQYNYLFAKNGDGKLAEILTDELLNPDILIQTYYYVHEKYVDRAINKRNIGCKTAFLGHRRVARNTDERTQIASIFPYQGVSNSWILSLGPNSIEMAILCSIYNSFCYDYLLRNLLSQPSIPQSTSQQVAVIPHERLNPTHIYYIIPRVIELIHISWEIQNYIDDIWAMCDSHLRRMIQNQWEENCREVKTNCATTNRPEWIISTQPEQYPFTPFRWSEKRRINIRAELDGLYAHLYGLYRGEFAYILDTFPIVRRKDEAKYGEYLTKRLCLEAYDRLAGSDLIPPEARALQQESVLGERAVLPAARPAPAVHAPGPGAAARPASPPDAPASQPATAQRPAKLPAGMAASQGIASKAEASAQQPALMDFSLYKCAACGKMLMGLEQEKHTRAVHGGKDPGYAKIGK